MEIPKPVRRRAGRGTLELNRVSGWRTGPPAPAGGIAGPWRQAKNGITGIIAAAVVAVVSISRYENIVVAGVATMNITIAVA
jgi:hypothetical protein